MEESELHVQDLQEELWQERRRERETRARDEERWRRQEEIHQQEAQELSQANAELQQMTEKNAELIEEVCISLPARVLLMFLNKARSAWENKDFIC